MPALRLRPAEPGDQEFLVRLYASTRARDLAALGLEPMQADAFVRLQFRAQSAHFTAAFPEAEHAIVVLEEHPVGRRIVDRSGPVLHVVDIALLAEFRGRGIGTSLLQAVLDEADARGLPVELHVDVDNPAQHLYRRLGFEVSADLGRHLRMTRRPALPGGLPAACPSPSVADRMALNA